MSKNKRRKNVAAVGVGGESSSVWGKDWGYYDTVKGGRSVRVAAQMIDSATTPERLSAYFSDATDEYADQISQESARREMRAKSRKVYINDGCTTHGTWTLADHCVGAGPMLSVIPQSQKGRVDTDPSAPTLSPGERSHIEWEWVQFADDIDLNEHLEMAVMSLEFDGELFFRMVYDPQISDVQLNLQQIEASRVRYPLEASHEDIVGGIKYDGLHPSWYYVLPKIINPNMDWNWESVQVPAEDMIHFVIMHLPDQHRGIPWMQSVLADIAETGLYEMYHLGAANAAARNSGGVVECDASYPAGESLDAYLRPSYAGVNPNEIVQLLPGLRYKQSNAVWPTATYNSYIDAKREKHAAGMQTTKSMLTGNYEKHSYSSFRGEIIVYWSMVERIRRRMAKLILNRLFERWLECRSVCDPVVSGVLDRYHGRLNRVPRTWMWGAIPAYDKADLIKAYNDAVRAGLMSRKMAVQEMGYDYEQVEQERLEDPLAPVLLEKLEKNNSIVEEVER